MSEYTVRGGKFPLPPALKVRHVSEHEITHREQFVITNFNGRQIAPSHDSAIEKRDELLLVGEEGALARVTLTPLLERARDREREGGRRSREARRGAVRGRQTVTRLIDAAARLLKSTLHNYRSRAIFF